MNFPWAFTFFLTLKNYPEPCAYIIIPEDMESEIKMWLLNRDLREAQNKRMFRGSEGTKFCL